MTQKCVKNESFCPCSDTLWLKWVKWFTRGFQCGFMFLKVILIIRNINTLRNPGGGHWPRKGVWGCAAVMTPFFQASRRSLAYQFTIIAPLLCPPFSNFRKIFHFQPCFGQNFSSQDANFQNFCSLDPLFFKENPLPRPYFWKPVWHTPTKKKKKKKKNWVPPRWEIHNNYYYYLWSWCRQKNACPDGYA